MNDNEGRVSVRTQQGVSVWVAGQEDLGQPSFQRPVTSERIGGITTRVGSGEATSQGTSRYTFGHDSGTVGGSVVATLRTSTGNPSVELVPGNPATRTSVQVAAREGLIRQDPATGQWMDARSFVQPEAATAEEQPGQDEQQQEQPQEGADAFDPEDESLWQADVADMPQAVYDATLGATIAAEVMGTDTSRLVDSLAQGAGISRELAAEYVLEGTRMYQRAAERAVAPVLTTPELRAAFRDSLKGDSQRAITALRHLTQGRDAGPLLDMARAFRASRS